MPDAATPVLRRLLAAGALCLALAPAASAQTWNESPDAGQLPVLAQVTAGTGPLVTINGELQGDFDADVYCVRLLSTPPANLPLVALQCVMIQGPNVYLFDANGMGIATNYTCAGGQKAILAPNVSLPPGTYYVAVSHTGWNPASTGGYIWQPNVLGQRAPDGPGAASPVWGWGGLPAPAAINPYSIGLNVNYFGYCDAPTPAAKPTWGSLKLHHGF